MQKVDRKEVLLCQNDTARMQIRCKVCGETVVDTALFCPYCGAPIKKRGSKPNNVPLIACICSLCFIIIIGSLIQIFRQHTPVTDTSSGTSPAAHSADTNSSKAVSLDTSSDTAYAKESVTSTSGNVTALTAEPSLIIPDDINDYHRVSFTSGDASSILERVNELYHYEPSRAFDDDAITSWQEGNKKTDGQGEWLELHMKESKPIKYLTLYLGNWRDSERYEGNNRPAELRISLGDTSFIVRFADVMKPQYVTFSKPIETDSIRFTITDVVVGTNGDHDCCISEVCAYSSE